MQYGLVMKNYYVRIIRKIICDCNNSHVYGNAGGYTKSRGNGAIVWREMEADEDSNLISETEFSEVEVASCNDSRRGDRLRRLVETVGTG